MKYSVVWSPEAEQELARLWIGAPNRDAITNAANSVDLILRDDAHGVGESRSATKRVVFVAPLGVLFSVRRAQQSVSVLSVWSFGTGPRRAGDSEHS